MTTLSYTAHPLAAGAAEPRPTGFVKVLVQAIGAEWRARRAARNVASLSDAMLHDIGLARGEIEQAVRHGRSSRG